MLIKPEGVARGIVGELISRVERKGLRIVGVRMLMMTEDMVIDHYRHLSKEEFFWEIKEEMLRGPVIAIALEGVNAVAGLRQIMGSTNPMEAMPGTMRADFALSITENMVHASDSIGSAEEEYARFFPQGTQ